jgi:uncharacterized membrane protein (DUF373 family)
MTANAIAHLVQRRFERLMALVLLILLGLVVGYVTLELAFRVIRYMVVIAPETFGVIGRAELTHLIHDAFGTFLLVLIGLELMQTIALYLKDDVLHAEIVLLVAIIAVARHAIDVDFATADPMRLAGMGLLIAGLAGAHFLFKRASQQDAVAHRPGPGSPG